MPLAVGSEPWNHATAEVEHHARRSSLASAREAGPVHGIRPIGPIGCRPPRAAGTRLPAPARVTSMNSPDGRVGPTRLVAEHVVADQARDPAISHAAGASRRAAVRELRAPTRGRGTARRRASAACRCRGRGPRGDRGPVAAPSTVLSVWSQRSSPGILSCGIPRWAARSGEMASSPVSAIAARRTDDGGEQSLQLVPIRSPDSRRTYRRCRGWRPAWPARSRSRARREPDGAHHAQRVLVEALGRVADRAQDRGREVRPAVGGSTSRACGPPAVAAPGHRVDREVAPRQVRVDESLNSTRCGRRKSAYSCSVRNGRDLELPSRVTGGPRPCRTRSRRRAPGKIVEQPLGQRVGREVPVRRLLGRGARRARTADDVRRVASAQSGRGRRGTGSGTSVARRRSRSGTVGPARPRQFRPRKQVGRARPRCGSRRGTA